MAASASVTVIDVTGPAWEAMRRSFDALSAALSSFETVPEMIRDQLERTLSDLSVEACDDALDLIRVEMVDRAAVGADKICLRCEPGDRYRELVAAVAAHGGDSFRLDLDHGWPILSVGVASTTVADGERAGNALPGGAA